MRLAPPCAVILVVIASVGEAADAPVRIPPELILREFPIARDGDHLLVPVTIQGKDRMFVVDTGATTTVVDLSIPLPEIGGTVTAADSQGKDFEVSLYTLSGATLRGLPLDLEPVAGLDLRPIREVSGQPVDGILGMDFLGRHVVHIDFDRGKLLLLKAAPPDAGDVLPIVGDEMMMPQVDVRISKDRVARFLIDTGCISHDSGSLEILEMRSLVRKGTFREIGATHVRTFLGDSSQRLFQSDRLDFGGSAVTSPILTETSGSPKLSLHFFSRFIVTFDFPRSRLYHRPSRTFAEPDRFNRSGLHILKRDGAVVVEIVDPSTPASRARLLRGDVLLKLADLDAGEVALSVLKEPLYSPGRYHVLFRRGGTTYQTQLEIQP